MEYSYVPEGSIVTPAGFRVGTAHCGIRTAQDQPDVALIACDGAASAAGCFTTNKFAAAPVLWCRAVLPSEEMRAVVVNAGNANACTGSQGAADVRATAELAAELIGCRPRQVCVASTGIIGHRLPMDRLSAGICAAFAALSSRPEAARMAERAIMTTDTRPKAAAVCSSLGGKAFHVGGMAKGSGMIAPRMATMLAFVTTDAAVPATLLQKALRAAVKASFNRITVDGDTSTNDSVIALASGASGARVGAGGKGFGRFQEALEAVLRELALQIVRDGEGATKLIEVRVSGAATEADAERAARAIAQSPLVKCAVHGGDPNWGRIVCALGYSGAQLCPERVRVRIGKVTVFANGTPTGHDASAELQGKEAIIEAHLGSGRARTRVWTCDLSEQYVRINAAYHT